MLDSSANYNYEGIKNRIIKSKIETSALDAIEKKVWLQIFYNAIICGASKLTKNEAIFFTKSFFENETEEEIAYILKISRQTLQNIKKSSIIKIYSELYSTFS